MQKQVHRLGFQKLTRQSAGPPAVSSQVREARQYSERKQEMTPRRGVHLVKESRVLGLDPQVGRPWQSDGGSPGEVWRGYHPEQNGHIRREGRLGGCPDGFAPLARPLSTVEGSPCGNVVGSD